MPKTGADLVLTRVRPAREGGFACGLRDGRELADPSLAGRRIGAIASRWGLADAAGFSRAFRAAYGVPPSEYRPRALGLRRD